MTAYNVRTTVSNGPSSNRIDIVFMGDGYRSTEIATKYEQHVESQLNYLFSGGIITEPFGRYAKFFNVHLIDVISEQSGADEPDRNSFKDTALGARYFFDGVTDRLLSVDNVLADRALRDSLAGTGITAELKIVTVNSGRYGGGGGEYAVFSGGNAEARDLAVHEIGHSFAGLGDHYDDGGPADYEGPEPVQPDLTTDPTGAKWAQWLGYFQPGLGIISAYEGGGYSENGIYRPSFNSKMNTLGRPFDAVGREQFILQFYRLVDPLDSWTANSTTLIDPTRLEVTPIDPEIIQTRWSIDGAVVADGYTFTLELANRNLISGDHKVRAFAYDDTDWVRLDRSSLHEKVNWTITLQSAVLNASLANPNLTGGPLTDRINGHEGINRLNGGLGNDTLLGNDGNDHLIGGGGGDALDGGKGIDVADFSDKSAKIELALQANNTVTVIINRIAEDTLRGIENVIGGSAGDSLAGDDLANLFEGRGGNDTIESGAGNDELKGAAGVDVLTSGSGNDTLEGGGDGDLMTGGSGDDLYQNTTAGDAMVELFNQGRDKITTAMALAGMPANIDVMEFIGAVATSIAGNNIGNTISAGALNDTVSGGDGNDSISGLGGDDALNGEAGADTLLGGGGQDELNGGQGNDLLEAGNQTDLVNGGPGNDTVQMLPGDHADAIDGGDHHDTLDLSRLKVATAIDLARGIWSAGSSPLVSISSVEDVIGGAGVDSLAGSSGNNKLGGGDANDSIIGNDGSDTLNGGNGDDILGDTGGADELNGGAGIDTMKGGIGNDIYTVDDGGDVTTEHANQGIDAVRTQISWTLAAEIENLALHGSGNISGIGNNSNNNLTGNVGDNVLNGLAGNDTMTGSEGDDVFVVDATGDQAIEELNEGTDTVRASVTVSMAANIENLLLVSNVSVDGDGNNLSNSITGNAGNNKLNGLLGSDVLDGAAGSDTFQFTTTLGTANIDSVNAYSAADDTIELSSTIFSAIGLGVLAADAFNIGPSAVDAEDRIIYNSATGALLYDADGAASAVAQQFAVLARNLTLTSAEFVVT